MTLKANIAYGVSLSVLIAAAGAHAQQRNFDVPSEPAVKSIPEFARQAGIQILAPASQLKDVVTPRVSGVRDMRDALKVLIAGTNLEVATDTGSVISLREIRRVSNRTELAAQPEGGSVATAPAALTETSAQPEGGSVAAAPVALAETSAVTSEVVVTGSRVIKNGNASPTPITVVSTDQLESLQPGPVAEALATLPVFSGSRTSVGNPGTGVSNAGADELDLRNLGIQRTLVLFDGHRVPPTTYDQIVDVDMIPQMLLQRVDVVTGGVSAVYGSDAIAGVVNFVTDTKFDGLKLDVEGGVSNYGDDQTVTAGIAVGRKFMDDRGHVELSYEYHNDPGILYRSDRPWGQDVWTVQGLGTAADPYALVRNTRIDTATFGGLISGATSAGAALNGMTFAQNGVLSPFVPGLATGTPAYQSGGSGAYYDGSLQSALQSHQFFGRFDYDFTDTVHGYVEGSDTINHDLNYGQYNQLSALTFNGQNAFLPAADQFAGTFKLSEFMQDMPRVDTNSQQNQYFVVGGLTGKLFNNYSWDVSYSHSNAQSTTRNDNQINNQNLYAALDAVVNPANGQIVCRAALTNSAYSNCVPLNVFGPTAASAAAIAYITQPTQFTVNNGQDDISGSISGSPFNDWAGPVTTALSAEWRDQTWSVSSTGQPTQTANCTGLMYNCTSSTLLYADATLANRSQVSNTVWEVADEAEIPLLKGLPFAKDLSFNGAVRYADYEFAGSAVTWKVGLTWQVTDELKLRATRSHDFRAPTLYELFQPVQVSVLAKSDELTGITAPVPIYTSGNPNLKPEVGDTSTAGFVYEPSWLPRFSLSMDAYEVRISDAMVNISGYGTGQTVCYTGAPLSSLPQLCTLQTRPINLTNTTPANAVTAWYTETINVSDVITYGADFEANYAAAVFDNPLTLRALVSWQPHNMFYEPGIAPDEDAGSAYPSQGSTNVSSDPVLRVSMFADYKIKNFEINIMERWRSALSMASEDTEVFSGTSTIPSVAYTDMTLSYKIDRGFGGTELFLNIQNLFNLQPPPAAYAGSNTSLGTFGGFAFGDDPIGRYFTVGIRFHH